jgi:hypothetical protein
MSRFSHIFTFFKRVTLVCRYCAAPELVRALIGPAGGGDARGRARFTPAVDTWAAGVGAVQVECSLPIA